MTPEQSWLAGCDDKTLAHKLWPQVLRVSGPEEKSEFRNPRTRIIFLLIFVEETFAGQPRCHKVQTVGNNQQSSKTDLQLSANVTVIVCSYRLSLWTFCV